MNSDAHLLLFSFAPLRQNKMCANKSPEYKYPELLSTGGFNPGAGTGFYFACMRVLKGGKFIGKREEKEAFLDRARAKKMELN